MFQLPNIMVLGQLRRLTRGNTIHEMHRDSVRPAWQVILPGLGLVLSRIIASQVLPVYDDAYITFRYARNLAAGVGFVYHAGEWILGTTSPLFGLLCSVFFFLHLPMPASVVTLNIFAD